MLEYSDDKVLELLRSSDTTHRSEALRHLYDTLFGYIGPFVIKNGGNVSDAEDLFQDGLIAFYEKSVDADFQLIGSIKNYVYGICRNLWFKKFRKGSKEFSVEDVTIYSQAEELEESNSDENIEMLDRYFLSLTEGCQQILKLYYYGRKNMNEIAEVMSLASGGVAKNKKARCLQKLKELFRAGNE